MRDVLPIPKRLCQPRAAFLHPNPLDTPKGSDKKETQAKTRGDAAGKAPVSRMNAAKAPLCPGSCRIPAESRARREPTYLLLLWGAARPGRDARGGDRQRGEKRTESEARGTRRAAGRSGRASPPPHLGSPACSCTACPCSWCLPGATAVPVCARLGGGLRECERRGRPPAAEGPGPPGAANPGS